MRIETYRIKLSSSLDERKAALMLCVGDESMQTEGFREFVEFLLAMGCELINDYCYLLNSNRDEVLVEIQDKLGFLRNGESILAFNSVILADGAQIWVPQKQTDWV